MVWPPPRSSLVPCEATPDLETKDYNNAFKGIIKIMGDNGETSESQFCIILGQLGLLVLPWRPSAGETYERQYRVVFGRLGLLVLP